MGAVPACGPCSGCGHASQTTNESRLRLALPGRVLRDSVTSHRERIATVSRRGHLTKYGGRGGRLGGLGWVTCAGVVVNCVSTALVCRDALLAGLPVLHPGPARARDRCV